MSRPMRIKVRVADLITKVEAAKNQAVADHVAAEKKYVADKAKYEAAAIKALQLALDKAKLGEFPEYYGYADALKVRLPKNVALPSEPTLNLRRFEKDLALLKACADDTLMVSADSDFGRYL